MVVRALCWMQNLMILAAFSILDNVILLFHGGRVKLLYLPLFPDANAKVSEPYS
jgi:hypothetical protein